MKKLISILLCLVLMFSVVPVAFAEAPEDGHSELFNEVVKALEKENLSYTADEYTLNEEEPTDEHIKLAVTDNELNLLLCPEITVDIYVNREENSIQMFIFNLIEYNEKITEKDFNAMLALINDLNYNYKYVKFSCDNENHSIDAEITSFVRLGCAGDIATDMVYILASITDSGKDALMSYSLPDSE